MGLSNKLQCIGVFVLLSVSPALRAAGWSAGPVPDVPGGKFSSMKLDRNGNLHVAHVDGFENVLRYSFWDRKLNKWFTTQLNKGTQYCSLALDSKQYPHISYPAGSGVVHHYWNGKQWIKQFANLHAIVINYYTSIALDANDYPSITYYEENGNGDNFLRLRMLTWNGSFWKVATVDGAHGSGKFNSMAIDSKGMPVIAYANVEYENLSLRFARWDGEKWNLQIIEKTGTSFFSVCMVLDSKDIPHIVYSDIGKRQIKYATLRDGKWQTEAVDSVDGIAYPDRNGIALDPAGVPYVSYYDAGVGLLKVAHKVGSRWVVETVDDGFTGYTSSIQVDDTVWVTYGDPNGQQLRFAHRPVEPSAAASAAGQAIAAKSKNPE